MSRHGRSGLLYHFLMGLGFLFLIGCFYLMQYLGFTEWVALQGPASHRGSLQMLAIMIWMTPAFLLWKYYLRWLNRKLQIKGIYYEDAYYGEGDTAGSQSSTVLPPDQEAETESKTPASQPDTPSKSREPHE